jgi:Flp pilus assembly protein TadB
MAFNWKRLLRSYRAQWYYLAFGLLFIAAGIVAGATGNFILALLVRVALFLGAIGLMWDRRRRSKKRDAG